MSSRQNVTFLSSPVPVRRALQRRAATLTTRCSAHRGEEERRATWTVPSRRQMLRLVTLAPLAALAQQAQARAKNTSLETMTAPIVMCRRVMNPVLRYIDQGAWDKGRTNVNYCTRVLGMRRNMRDAAELLQGDAYYDALDTMGEMDNIMSQLDASLYTPLFIPGEDGQITIEQNRYQVDARGFYAQAIDGLDKFLSVVPSDILNKAIAIADDTKYEIPLELNK